MQTDFQSLIVQLEVKLKKSELVFEKEVQFLKNQNLKVQKDNTDLVKLNIKLKQIILSEASHGASSIIEDAVPSDYSSEDEYEDNPNKQVHIFGKRYKQVREKLQA